MEKIKERIKAMGRARVITLLLVLSLGAALILIPEAKKTEESDPLYAYKVRLESELSELCSSVEGAGKCIVYVSFSEGESYEYQGGQIKTEKPPRVLGVTVLCEGGSRSGVRARITEIISSLFDVGANRICVLKLS